MTKNSALKIEYVGHSGIKINPEDKGTRAILSYEKGPQTYIIKADDTIEPVFKWLGEDPFREGLKDTPKRYLKFLYDFLHPEPFQFTTFENEGMDEMVIVKDIQFNSLCEHHMLPFMGHGHIAYIPNEKIVGLSKIPRVLEMFSRRLQNQERITNQVAEYLMEHLKPKGVAVTLSATHTCMGIRGIQKPDALTITSSMKGVFLENQSCREEFLNLIK